MKSGGKCWYSGRAWLSRSTFFQVVSLAAGFTFIYIVLFTLQIVSKQLYSDNWYIILAAQQLLKKMVSLSSLSKFSIDSFCCKNQ